MASHSKHSISIHPGEKHDVPDSSTNDLDGGGPHVNSPTRTVTGFWWAVVVLAIVSSTFLYALDNTVMANIRPDIVDSPGHMEMLPWMSVSYPMGEVGSCPFWGAMYARFNNKWLYVITVLLFEVGSAVIGSAQSMNSLIVGRVIAGFGGSGIYVGTLNILSVMTTNVERAQYLSYVGVAWSIGTVCGPIVGGAFSHSSATWRWAFYINICIAAAAAPACLWFIPSHRPDTQNNLLQRIKRLDLVGALLFIGGIACLILILGFGGAIWRWDSGRMIALYVSAAVIWTTFVIQQWRSILTTDRIFPAQFVADWEMCILFCQTSIAISNIIVTIYTLPLFFQFVYGDSSLRSGLFILAVTAAAIVAAGGGGAVFPKYTMYMPWFAVACTLSLIGSALLTTISSDTTRGVVCGYAVIQLVGCGLVVQLPFTVAQVKAPTDLVRPVTSFLATAQMAGLALSLGITTSVFVNRGAADIGRILPDIPREAVYASLGGAGTAVVDALQDGLREKVLAVIARNVGRVFYANVASGAFGLLLSLAMKRERLSL